MTAISDLNTHAVGRQSWMTAAIAVPDNSGTPAFAEIAKVRGHFAVHRSVATSRYLSTIPSRDYVLTHILTGAKFEFEAGESELMALAEKLSGLWDWCFTDPARVKVAPRRVIDAVRAARAGFDAAA